MRLSLQAIVFRGFGLDVTFGIIGLVLGAGCVHFVIRSVNRRDDPRHRQLPRDLPDDDDPFRNVSTDRTDLPGLTAGYRHRRGRRRRSYLLR